MHTRSERKQSGKQILIYGAGSEGRLILTEILENSNYDYHVVGFLDDNPTLYKTGIFNTPVLGGLDSLDEILELYKIDEVILAMPSKSRSEVQPILNALTKHNVDVRKVSSS